MLKTFFLALKCLWRDARAGEWTIVFIALLLAITAITSIHFYTDRLIRGLDQQSATFLGGDVVVTSASAIPNTWIQKADALHLRHAQVWSYPSVIHYHNQLQLINVQAVSDSFPLLGLATQKPAAHTMWVEPRLLPLLSIKLNDTLTIGAANFRISQLLTPDVDTLHTGFLIAPSVMLRLDDVPATQTVVPGSRIDYRLLLAGDHQALQQFQQWITPLLHPGQSIVNVHTQSLPLKDLVDRAENYLQLVLLVCLLMSGVAIALSIQPYLRRHSHDVALWRCLGAKRQQIIALLIWQLILIALFAGGIGITLGYIAQSIFAHLFQSFLQFPLPPTSSLPVLLGFISSFLLLFAFAYPIISELPKFSPLAIWRQDKTSLSTFKSIFYMIGGLLLISLWIAWLMQFSTLTLYFLAILFISLACLYLFSLLLLFLCRSLLPYTNGAMRRGLSQITHHAHSISLQFIGFNFILISLMTLGLVRTHLFDNWQQTLPSNTPNYFAFNIADSDLPALKQFFTQHQLSWQGIYPMVRGRLMTLNGKPILKAVPAAALSNNALHRELNLSWMWQLPADNNIVQGRAFTLSDQGKPLVSVEDKLAHDLHLKLGDALTFQIGDQTLTANIVNFRRVEWSSFHPNFFMIFTPGLLQAFPTTYITSFHLASSQTDLLNGLLKQFPNITVIDVASLLLQMQTLMGKITLAIQYLFLFALGAGLLIFITSLQASMDERKQTYSLLRLLGASKRYIRNSLIAEFACLGLCILFTTLCFSASIVYVLESFIFNL